MPVTKQPITNIGDQWLEVHAQINEPTGTPLTLQNTGSSTLLIALSDERPTTEAGRHLYPLKSVTVNEGQPRLWVKNIHKSGQFSRLQADVTGGFTGANPDLFPDRIYLQTPQLLATPVDEIFLEVTNNSEIALTFEQLIDIEAIPDGITDGVSAVGITVFFNPNDAGSNPSPSNSQAFINGYDGKFENVTNSLILVRLLGSFDLNTNREYIALASGTASYYSAQQSLTVTSINRTNTFISPPVIAPQGKIVIAFRNQAVVDGGVDVFMQASFSFKYLTYNRRPALPSDNLTYEGDQLTYENDILTYKA